MREVAKELADEYDKRVNVVDTSNEIAGEGKQAPGGCRLICAGRAATAATRRRS